MVPTVDTLRYDFLIHNLLAFGRPVLMVGPVGTGKTSVAQGVLQKLDTQKYNFLTINLSAQVYELLQVLVHVHVHVCNKCILQYTCTCTCTYVPANLYMYIKWSCIFLFIWLKILLQLLKSYLHVHYMYTVHYNTCTCTCTELCVYL